MRMVVYFATTDDRKKKVVYIKSLAIYDRYTV